MRSPVQSWVSLLDLEASALVCGCFFNWDEAGKKQVVGSLQLCELGCAGSVYGKKDMLMSEQRDFVGQEIF